MAVHFPKCLLLFLTIICWNGFDKICVQNVIQFQPIDVLKMGFLSMFRESGFEFQE